MLGEIGIGNTTVAAALLAAQTGLSPEDVCGRGTGLDAEGVQPQRAGVAAGRAANHPGTKRMTRSVAWCALGDL